MNTKDGIRYEGLTEGKKVKEGEGRLGCVTTVNNKQNKNLY